MNPGDRPARLSLRRLLALAMGGVAIYVLALSTTVAFVFLPRITTLRADTEDLIAELDGYATESERLDAAVELARGALEEGDLEGAKSALEDARGAPGSSLSATGARAMAGAPLEMRSALANAAEGESSLRDRMGEALAYLELGDPERARRTLEATHLLAQDLVGELARAQGAGLRDVQRRGIALEEAVSEASRVFLLGAAAGLLFVALLAFLVHRRLYIPLRALDVGMRALGEGDLTVQLEVGRADELGRLAALFNRTTQVLKARDMERRTERKEVTRRILDSALDAVITIEPGGAVTGWNPGAEAIFGWSDAEMLGATLERIIPEEHRDEHLRGLRKYRFTVDAPMLNRRLELPALRKDGTRFTAELSVVPIVEEGRKVAYTAFLRDVTEQRRAEEAVRKSEELLRAIIDNSSAVITMKDLDLRYRMVNRRWAEIFGVDPVDALGRTVADMAAAETAEEAMRHDLEVLAARQAIQFEEYPLTPTGRRHYVSIRFPLLDDAGEPRGVASIATDVTESVELEEQVRRSQRLEAVGRLAGGIAHDFNNLVTIILGQTQLTLEVDAPQEVIEGLKEIEKAAERAGVLTSQLLAFARKQIIAPEQVDLNDLVRENLGMVHRVMEATVTVHVDLSPTVGTVNVDRGHFSQVMLNLIINSRDALGAAGGNIFIRTGPADAVPEELAAGTYALLTVEDDGPGIPDEVLPRIFEPFFTTKRGGTGLGLSTCHGIVNQAGGTIQAANDPEGGARFSVWLPLLADEEQPIDGRPDERRPDDGHAGGR